MKQQLLIFLGFSMVLLMMSCGENAQKDNSNNQSATPIIPTINVSVIKSYPHDTSSFTQGLTIYKGKLYEGTGGDVDSPPVSSKNSHLYQIDLATGKALRSVPLDDHYFGEGITILNDTIYQLTWTEKKVLVYTLDFKKVKEFEIQTEGWGITHNSKELIVSDGTSNLYFYDPQTFQLLHTQTVTFNGEMAYNINELEYIEGFVYANVWQQPYIWKIDPNNGLIVGRIDLSAIWQGVNGSHSDEVPNGIAYDVDTKKIYITGKKWPVLYEIQLGQ